MANNPGKVKDMNERCEYCHSIIEKCICSAGIDKRSRNLPHPMTAEDKLIKMLEQSLRNDLALLYAAYSVGANPEDSRKLQQETMALLEQVQAPEAG